MDAQKQRIAIAEACGAVWKRQSCNPWSPDDDSRNVYFRRLHFISPGDIRGAATLPGAIGSEAIADDHPIPDYLNDLNAMHEAEKALPSDKIAKYAAAIWMAMCASASKSDLEIGTIHATAAQRAEAFLRTIGKWESE